MRRLDEAFLLLSPEKRREILDFLERRVEELIQQDIDRAAAELLKDIDLEAKP